jgi:hypothetical protein
VFRVSEHGLQPDRLKQIISIQFVSPYSHRGDPHQAPVALRFLGFLFCLNERLDRVKFIRFDDVQRCVCSIPNIEGLRLIAPYPKIVLDPFQPQLRDFGPDRGSILYGQHFFTEPIFPPESLQQAHGHLAIVRDLPSSSPHSAASLHLQSRLQLCLGYASLELQECAQRIPRECPQYRTECPPLLRSHPRLLTIFLLVIL